MVIPIIGVKAALAVVEHLEADRYEAAMAISLLVEKCEAILVLGESPGVNRERDLVEAKGLPVYRTVGEIPATPLGARAPRPQ